MCGDISKVYFKASYCFRLLQCSLRVFQQPVVLVIHCIQPYSHDHRECLYSWGLQNGLWNIYSLSCFWHRFGLKYNQGIGLLGFLKHSKMCWSRKNNVAHTVNLRVWHWIPSHCGGQWHVLGPIHSPPFLHSWRQMAAQTSSQSLVISQVVTFTYYIHFRLPRRCWMLFMHKSHLPFTENVRSTCY